MPSAKPIDDRAAITDHICDVMQERFRSTTIDTLLCRPIDALTMAIDVAARSGRIKKSEAKHIQQAIDEIADREARAFDTLNEILRAAISARKRGDLKGDKR